MSQFALTPWELENRTLKEQFWFLMFLGAKFKEVEDILGQHVAKRHSHSALGHSKCDNEFSDLMKPWAIFAPRQGSSGSTVYVRQRVGQWVEAVAGLLCKLAQRSRVNARHV